MYNDHLKTVAVVDSRSLIKEAFLLLTWETGPQKRGGCRKVVVYSGLTVSILTMSKKNYNKFSHKDIRYLTFKVRTVGRYRYTK